MQPVAAARNAAIGQQSLDKKLPECIVGARRGKALEAFDVGPDLVGRVRVEGLQTLQHMFRQTLQRCWRDGHVAVCEAQRVFGQRQCIRIVHAFGARGALQIES